MKQNETIIIAGASQGLGRDLASFLIDQGFSLALISRRNQALNQIAALSGHDKGMITTHAIDLSDSALTHKAFKNIQKSHVKIKGLINCAATWMGGISVREMTAEQMESSWRANFMTAFNPIKEFINIDKQKLSECPTIINIGATASLRGNKNMAAFASVKSALRTFSQSLAKELGPEGIHVAHVIIDGLLANDRTFKLNPDRPKEEYLDQIAVCQSILNILQQPASSWTFEWDLRPFNEKW
jgi:short-subunit dehydrogenase